MNVIKWLNEPDGNGFPRAWGFYILITMGVAILIGCTVVVWIFKHVRII